MASNSLVILELSPTTEKVTRDWLVEKLKKSKEEGGADLLVCAVESVVHDGSCLLHIGATQRHLEKHAEEVGLRKRRHDSQLMRDFDYDNKDAFEPLNSADILKVIKHDLDNLRASADDSAIPGLDNIKPLYPGKSIFRRLQSAHVLTQAFPLHDPDTLDSLKQKIVYHIPFVSEMLPLQDIKEYFGESISFYFAFLGYFSVALLPVVCVAFPYYLFGGRKDFESFLVFAIYNLIWASLLIEIWKRKSNRHAFQWGTLSLQENVHEEPRAGHHGPLRENPVTERMEPHSSDKWRYLRILAVTCPVVAFCMLGAALFMQLYFYFEDMSIVAYDADPSTMNNVVSFVPCVLYSIVIFLSNMAYRPLAHRLTDFENHRTETAHHNHLVLKILLFDSFNCFGALFYVAFWEQDVKRLRADLASLLIMNQILEQLQETIMPSIMTWKAKRRFKGKKAATRFEKLRMYSDLDEAKLVQAETEADMPPYEGTFDDYLELFLHFGYISLFSCVYPLASIWAFINNILETRTDGYKFVAIHQRPFPQVASNIGVWQIAFEMMGIVAILTNVSLIGMSKDFKATFEGVLDQWQVFMMLLLAEHLLVFLKFVVSQVIPDWPLDVRNQMYKEDFESHKALKQTEKEKLKKA